MGSGNTTHIANAYKEPIYIKTDSERFHVESMNASAQLGVDGVFNVGSSMSMQGVWNKFIEVGFAKLPPREFIGVSPKVEGGGRVYISIWCASVGWIWKNLPQQEDISFIVKNNGHVEKAKYGEIWVDRRGNRH